MTHVRISPLPHHKPHQPRPNSSNPHSPLALPRPCSDPLEPPSRCVEEPRTLLSHSSSFGSHIATQTCRSRCHPVKGKAPPLGWTVSASGGLVAGVCWTTASRAAS